jgi:hypothetical protein
MAGLCLRRQGIPSYDQSGECRSTTRGESFGLTWRAHSASPSPVPTADRPWEAAGCSDEQRFLRGEINERRQRLEVLADTPSSPATAPGLPRPSPPVPRPSSGSL